VVCWPLQGTQRRWCAGRCRVRSVGGVLAVAGYAVDLVVAGYAVWVVCWLLQGTQWTWSLQGMQCGWCAGRCRVRSCCRVPGVQPPTSMCPLVGGTKWDLRCMVEVRFLKFPILNRTSQPADRPPKFRTPARVCKDPLEYTRREKKRGSGGKGVQPAKLASQSTTLPRKWGRAVRPL
jgi:hypothetical protein